MTANLKNKVVKGISSQAVVTIVLGVVEIVSFSIMSRLLSQEDFGYYAAISAVTVVFASFAETGIGSALIQRKDLDSKFVNNAFTISFLFGVFISLLLLGLSVPLSRFIADSSMAIPLMLMSITLFCNCLSSVGESLMYRRLEFLQVGMINLFALIVTTIVAILLALKGLGYYAILTKAILTSIITLVLSLIFAKTRFKFALDRTSAKNIFGFSGWLMASVFFRNLASQMDKLLMSRFLSVTSLGRYNRPKEFIGQISSKFGNIFDTALFPVLSQIQDDLESMRKAYLRSMYVLNLASVVLAILFIFNGDLIIRIFFGEYWLNVLPIFMILSLSVVFHFLARLADCYLRSLGWTKQQFYFRVVEVSVKIVGLLIGYRWDIIGIAISVLVSEMICVLIKHGYIADRVGISVWEGIGVLVKAWQFTLVFVPIMLLVTRFIPHSLAGDLVNAGIFCVMIVICFILVPSIPGKQYKDEIYQNYILKVLVKLHLRK